MRVLGRLLPQPDDVEQLAGALLGLVRDRRRMRRTASVRLSITFRCGKRLNCWKTIPMRCLSAVTSTPFLLISSPSKKIRPSWNRLEQVHAAQQCALAASARPDHDEHLAALHVEVDPVEDEVVAEALPDAIQPDDRFPDALGDGDGGAHAVKAPRIPTARSISSSSSATGPVASATARRTVRPVGARRSRARRRPLRERPQGARARRSTTTRRFPPRAGPAPTGIACEDAQSRQRTEVRRVLDLTRQEPDRTDDEHPRALGLRTRPGRRSPRAGPARPRRPVRRGRRSPRVAGRPRRRSRPRVDSRTTPIAPSSECSPIRTTVRWKFGSRSAGPATSRWPGARLEQARTFWEA